MYNKMNKLKALSKHKGLTLSSPPPPILAKTCNALVTE